LNGNENYDSILHDFEMNRKFCPCVLSFIKTLYFRNIAKIKLFIDSLLFSLVMIELRRSRTYRSNVLKRFHYVAEQKYKKYRRKLKVCPSCSKSLWFHHVDVFLKEAKRNVIDYKWNKKLEVLINERCELENAMAWLSTLGGAFSALGDYFNDFAEKACLISVQQFRIALRLGDPITICQCKIYFAMSLIQRGYYSKAKILTRELYSYAIGPDGSKDFRLKNMCIAVWNKLRYVLSIRRKNVLCKNGE